MYVSNAVVVIIPFQIVEYAAFKKEKAATEATYCPKSIIIIIIIINLLSCVSLACLLVLE